MKTKEQIIEAVKSGKESATIDGRDFSRLVIFFPISDWGLFGFSLKDGLSEADVPEPKELTRENILAKLADDVAFGIGKALSHRGISSYAMYEVVKMWMWVLDDPLQYHDDYHSYGLPFFTAVAKQYGIDVSDF